MVEKLTAKERKDALGTLPGWEEEIFPHRRALDEGGGAALEEERRLAYVGLTRARQKVLVSFASNRRIYNQWQTSLPSRFVSELPEDKVDYISAGGLMGLSNDSFSENLNTDIQNYSPRRTQLIDSEDWQVKKSGSSFTYKVGMRIFHQKFGYGIIKEIDDCRLTISFDKAGQKKVLDSFVELT